MRSPSPLLTTTTTHLLEINIISAQGLKPPSTALRRLQPYAVAWVDPSTKLRTPVDRLGSDNPTWNDKFLFRISPSFLSSPTSAISVDIFSVGIIKDHFLGSARLLLSTLPHLSSSSPSFAALQLRRPSGRFLGLLNLGAMLIDHSDLSFASSLQAVGFRDLMGGNNHRRRLKKHRSDSAEFSDGTDSTASGSSTSSVLKEINGVDDGGGDDVDNGGLNVMMCGLGFLKKVHIVNVHALGSLDLENCR